MGEPSHVINIDIQDNHEEATIGAFMICDLCAMVGLFWCAVYLSFVLLLYCCQRYEPFRHCLYKGRTSSSHGPASVAQVTETQCAPTGTVYQRSRGSISWVGR